MDKLLAVLEIVLIWHKAYTALVSTAHYGHLPPLNPQGTEFTSICRDIISHTAEVAAKWI